MNKYLTDELKKEIIDYYKSDLHSIKEGSIKFSLKTKTL